MCALRTSLTYINHEDILKIMGGMRISVPVGFNHQNKEQDEWLNDVDNEKLSGWSVIENEYNSSLKQIGTLGGGNHFIEIQKGDDGRVWIMIHSGSRNIGYKVADHYNKLAIKLNSVWCSSVPKEHQLAFLPINSEEGQNYLTEMRCCVDFALANRKFMMNRVKEAFVNIIDDIKFDNFINIAHNYAVMENHFNTNVMIHRKGATSARLGEQGIIPGSQGTSSYIVSGKGNKESFMSCSHGAGRMMGRKQARKMLNLEDEQRMLDDIGVIHSIRNKKDLDEAPSAYKDISVVMKNQEDLVDIVVELKPLAVIKG